MHIRKKKINKQSLFVLWFFCVICLISILLIRHLDSLYAPWVNNDETGYWGAAAYFAGYDWSDILQYSDYYSFGYGIILAPLFLILKTPVLLYRGVIIINVLFVVLVYIIAYKIIRMLYDSIESYTASLIALMSTLTSGTILQAETAWAETTILLFTWLIFFTFLKYLFSKRRVYLVCFALCNAYIYMVHQRMIGILIASLLVLVICLSQKKISLKNFFLVCIIIILGVIVASIVKDGLQYILWNKGDLESNLNTVNVNDYSGQMEKIRKIFSSGANFLLFCKLALGKIFYFVYASYFMFPFVIFCVINKIVSKKWEFSISHIFLIFVFLSAILMLGITSAFMYPAGRNDTIIYGRYAETIVGPCFLVGICTLLTTFNRKKFTGACLCLFGSVFEIIVMLFIKNVIWNYDQETFTLNIPVMARYIVDGEFYLTKFTVEILIISLIFSCVMLLYSNKKNLIWLLTAVLIFLNIQNEKKVYDWYIQPLQAQKKQIIDMVENNSELLESLGRVYFMTQDEFNPDANRNTIQFAMRELEIISVDEQDYKKELENMEVLFINKSNPKLEYIMDEFQILDENSILVLAVKK